MPPLGDAPEIVVVRDRTPGAAATGGFLDVHRLDVAVRRADGTQSAPVPYDMVRRRALDAAVMAVHYESDGAVYVYLRSALRPPLALRAEAPVPPRAMWELPAGLVEPGESPRAAAAREIGEELGFAVAESDVAALGPASIPLPAVIAEWQHYFHVAVDPAERTEPAGDGTPLEEDAAIEAVPLEVALEACRRGELVDTKSELALRRLHELLGAGGGRS